jgi:hypothetical protein
MHWSVVRSSWHLNDCAHTALHQLTAHNVCLGIVCFSTAGLRRDVRAFDLPAQLQLQRAALIEHAVCWSVVTSRLRTALEVHTERAGGSSQQSLLLLAKELVAQVVSAVEHMPLCSEGRQESQCVGAAGSIA